MRGRTIRQFLIEGTPEGRWVSELSNWTGKAYKIPRPYVASCTDRPDLDRPGVYFLFGKSDETNQPQVYIGEAENILARLKQHLSGKEFWTEAIAFVSKDTNLNKAHIKFLEYRLYRLAQEARRYELLNANQPTESSVSEMDQAELEEFIDNMRLLLNVLGHKVLEPVTGAVPGTVSSPNTPQAQSSARTIFYLTDRSGAKASGLRTSEGFVILAGSQFNSVTQSSLPQSGANQRCALREKGLLSEDFTLQQDCLFNSPSAAAQIVVGYSINGRIAWKTEDGQSLKDFESEATVT